jgi:hypothetical protein
MDPWEGMDCQDIDSQLIFNKGMEKISWDKGKAN